jgi:ATP-dependent helicase/nuclease subunit B
LVASSGTSAVAAIATEVEGTLAVPAAGGIFELSARADRIDTLTDGRLAVIDYKTGAPPSTKQVAAGFAPQLPLEAAIAERGRFAGVAGAPIAALEYWRLGGGREPGRRSPAGKDPKALADDALEGLTELIAEFSLAETPYYARPRPSHAPQYSDYEHLERVREWAAVGGEDG